MQTLAIHVDDIEIGERHRALSTDAVERLAASMRDIGLKQPITVRITDNIMIDGKPCDGVPVLVAGAHRLAAAKALGWAKIDCIEIDDDPIAAELWEIAENLHRCDLTKEQRDQHIRRYAELLMVREQQANADAIRISGQVVQKSPGRPKEVAAKVAAEIAESTGLSQRTVRRALNPRPTEVVEVKDDHDVIAAQVDAILRAWNRACPEARAIALERLDTPIMDRAA